MFGFSKSRIIVYLKIIHKACLEHRFTHTLIIWDIFKVFFGVFLINTSHPKSGIPKTTCITENGRTFGDADIQDLSLF